MNISIRRGVALALLVYLFPTISFARQSSAGGVPVVHEHEALEETLVTANPLGRESADLSQSATVLQGDALRQQLANSLGETLARMPGLANASFGENIGRPVIRGLQGTRVGILSNNMAVSDASAVSQDHAVSVEPFLTDQVEVLRGPSTLLYGSGAIGGVVNMVSPSIPQAIPETGYSGRATAQANTAANEEFAAGRLEVGASDFVLHVDGFHRRTDDYEIPGSANLYPEDENIDEDEKDDSGVLANSFLDNQGGALGGSWIGEQWRLGVAYTEYKADYGIPGEVHGHEAEHGDELEAEDPLEEEAPVSINLKSRRTESELLGRDPFGGFELLKVQFVDSNYEHTEYEGNEVGTIFNSDTTNTRVELTHNPWGTWQGVFGLQYTDLDFSAVGAEAFVPKSKTETGAIFWIERVEFDAWQFEIGLRYDDVDINVPNTLVAGEGPVGPTASAEFEPLSASAGSIWQLDESTDLIFTVAHTERAPGVDELFANGPHIATRVFEVGDEGLDTESSLHVEGGVRVTLDRFTGSATVFSDSFNDYIYQAGTGLEEDGLPLLLWSQQDADFIGAEVELRYDFDPNSSGHWQLFGFGDIVDAELADNTDVPRLPPKRVGLGMDWDRQGLAANVVWIHAYRQDNIAPFETPTPGYDLLNAELVITLPSAGQYDWQVYLKGQNLLDEDIRNSTSYLKDFAPQIGRNIILGTRVYF
jgi:iron complex outermembrane receptor protein